MKENHEINEPSQANEFEFLQEKIKERPINKKKLLQRIALTASLALLFGLIACFTFLLLEPVLNNWLYPEEEPMTVTFPQEKDEMLPEDMLTEGDEETQASAQEKEDIALADKPNVEETADSEAEQLENDLIFYKEFYQGVQSLYKQISASMVTITGVKSDVDWFNNTYESEGTIAGVIIANNNRELLMLTKRSPLKDAQSIRVTFCDGASAEGSIKKTDVGTNLAVVAVELEKIKESTLEAVTVATLGSSADAALQGSPVLAVGNILGYKDSVCYGMVTSVGNTVGMADNQYKLLTTDIYGSQNPTGILVGMDGSVIGILDNTYNNEETSNLLSAIGITELKGMIAMLSNGIDIPYAGLYVQDISSEARKELGLPKGAYISNIDMGSPAMKNGIQKGDIIVRIGEKEITNATDYMNVIRGYAVGRNVTISILRYSAEEYKEMQFTVELVAAK